MEEEGRRNANIERGREKNEEHVIIEREGRCYRLIKGYRDS